MKVLLTHVARIYQLYSLKMNLKGLKHVAVIYIVLIQWWFNNIWVHLCVFTWCSDTSAQIWTR